MVKFAFPIDVDEDTLSKTDIHAAKLLMGCENVLAIAADFNVTIGNQLCKIHTSIICKIAHPRDPVVTSNELKQVRSQSDLTMTRTIANPKVKGIFSQGVKIFQN